PTCWFGRAGGSLVVRAAASADAGDMASVLSLNVTVMVAKYSWPPTSDQPSAAPKLWQNCAGTWHTAASEGCIGRESCAAPVSGSKTVAIHDCQPEIPGSAASK